MVRFIGKRASDVQVYELLKVCDYYNVDTYWLETLWQTHGINNTEMCKRLCERLNKNVPNLNGLHINGIVS